MTNSFQESFNIPPGFAIEEVKGQLYHEDLEEDDELWLIRMPCDIELSTLDKRKIFLSNEAGGLSIKNFKTESNKSLECYAETSEISNTCVVLPKRQDEQLHAVKKAFIGSVLISEGLSLNNESEIKSEDEENHLNDSHSISEINGERAVMGKKKSRSDPDANECNINYEEKHEDSSNNFSSKKNKGTKKRHSQTGFDSCDFNCVTEENMGSPNLQKKKKHSKSSRKSSEKLQVKDRCTSMDLNEDNYLSDSCSISDINGEKAVMNKKKSHSGLDTSDSNINYEEECEDSNSFSSKKKKSAKKKKHSQTGFNSSDLNCENVTAEPVDSHNLHKKKKHSKSSRKSSEKLQVKDGCISMDLDDGFPTCNSQK